MWKNLFLVYVLLILSENIPSWVISIFIANCLLLSCRHTVGWSTLILDWIPAATVFEEISYLHYALQPFLGPVQCWLFSDAPNPLYLPLIPSGRPPWEEITRIDLNNTFSIHIQRVKSFCRLHLLVENVLKWSGAKYGQAASCMETLLFLFYLKLSPTGRQQTQSQVITKQLRFFQHNDNLVLDDSKALRLQFQRFSLVWVHFFFTFKKNKT